MTKRRAWSPIELLVVLSIVGVLSSILLVSLGSAREAARRTQCQNNLRQLGIGLHSFVISSGGVLPKQRRISVSGHPDEVGPWFDMADELELTQHAKKVISPAGNVQHLSIAVELLMCPSDGEAGCNYRTCGSSGYSLLEKSSFWPRPSDTGDGLIPCIADDRYFAHVRDGLSNTAFAAERLVSGGDSMDRRAVLHRLGIIPSDISSEPPHAELVEAVRQQWGSGLEARWIGKLWHGLGLGQTAYNHAAPPNEETAAIFGGTSIDATVGVVPPTSSHPGGVNLCRADGSVTFVSDQIDGAAWAGLATIAAGD